MPSLHVLNANISCWLLQYTCVYVRVSQWEEISTNKNLELFLRQVQLPGSKMDFTTLSYLNKLYLKCVKMDQRALLIKLSLNQMWCKCIDASLHVAGTCALYIDLNLYNVAGGNWKSYLFKLYEDSSFIWFGDAHEELGCVRLKVNI